MTYYNRYTMNTKHALLLGALAVALLVAPPAAQGGGNCIEMRNGYFWDPLATNYWIPHGFGYQTINGPEETKD